MYRQEYLLKLEALNCIEEEAQKIINLEINDPEQAFSRWSDLLCDYSAYLNDREFIRLLIDEVFFSICYNHQDYSKERVMMERIIPFVAKHPEVFEIIYGIAGMAGGERSRNYSTLCLACCILSDQAATTYKIIEYLSKNKNIKGVNNVSKIGPYQNIVDFSSGKFLAQTYECIIDLINDKSEYKVTEEVKEALNESIKLFDNHYDRAECTIPIMAIIGYE